jgi:hypothetical protein
MRASLLIATLSNLIDRQMPCLVEGTPGLGKTQVFEGIAKRKGFTIEARSYVHLHGPTLQPEDLGLPAVNVATNTHTFTTPDWFPAVGRTDIPEFGMICIDELPQAEVSVQKVCANIIQQREIHGTPMKAGWTVVATGNRQEDGAGANRLLSHLRDRVLTLQFEPNLDDWCAWASANDVRPEVVAFLRFKPGLLTNFDRNNKINATPRGWAEGVSRFLGTVPYETELECFQGRVGEGPAAEFVGFLRIFRELPDPDSIISSPTTAVVPTAMNVLYALCMAVSYRATQENFGNVIDYVKRLPPEYGVLLVRDAMIRCPAVTSTRAFATWAATSGGDVLL